MGIESLQGEEKDSLLLGGLLFSSFKTGLSDPFNFSQVHYQMVRKFWKMAECKCKMLISKRPIQ